MRWAAARQVRQVSLLRTDAARQQTLFSVFKKLVEQAGRQLALMFVAGADEAWQKLPRDVAPRFRRRDPLQVGSLTLDEKQLFMRVYSQELPSSFTAEAVRTLHRLSGGSPRELLRIAYHAYEYRVTCRTRVPR